KPGDVITAYVSHKKGLVVHTADCTTFLRIPDIENRRVEVSWDTDQSRRVQKQMEKREADLEKSKAVQIEKTRFRKIR
ncbi:MAG: bifunctional (p)ppGpp synthetase/guanosine-3',5'-bis(diphosphate) 3'-pyrophosphohydrolase, partial [Treponema sp.]|nr:bifunctional (p)ppGpp synthetase/guanosine-3',5'-bis(diphosphate) 3'-pyrophosphohydrolase [Treponema sp.]